MFWVSFLGKKKDFGHFWVILVRGAAGFLGVCTDGAKKTTSCYSPLDTTSGHVRLKVSSSLDIG